MQVADLEDDAATMKGIFHEQLDEAMRQLEQARAALPAHAAAV